MTPFEQELLRGLLSLVSSCVALSLGWLITGRVTARWNLRQKRSEIVLSTLGSFQLLYGKFYSAAKLWNNLVSSSRAKGESSSESDTGKLLRLEVIRLEGELEAFIVKAVCEYEITDTLIERIARFREGYHSLRRSMKSDSDLSWFAKNNPDYAAFKTLAAFIVSELANERTIVVGGIEATKAASRFLKVTSNEFRETWSGSRPNALPPESANVENDQS